LNTGEQLVETNFFDIQISSGAEKCLGIYVGTDKIKCEQKNWYDKVTKIEHTLTTWAKRDLTYFGRITIIKTLILPIINFVGYNTIIPDWVFIKLERLFFKFLWSGHDKMKRSSVIGDLKYGGLNMVDIKSFLYSQKYKWLNCILENGGNCNWSFIPFTYFESLGIDKFIYGVNSEVIFESSFFNKIPHFYRQILQFASRINASSNVALSEQNIYQQYLWGNNSFVNNKNQVLFFPKWIFNNIIKVSDLPFLNNQLDTCSLMSIVDKHPNIWIELLEMKQCLSKYKQLLLIPVQEVNTQRVPFENKKIYQGLIMTKFTYPFRNKIWCEIFGIESDVLYRAFNIKVRNIKHKKIPNLILKYFMIYYLVEKNCLNGIM
jgi:hypothetical protein